MKIILTGGGTAGHVTPHQAILPYLKNDFDEFAYIGSKAGIEKKFANEMSLTYHEITTTKFVRKRFWKNLAIPFLLCKGTREAKKILKQFKPSVVFSKGGFVSVPVVRAASRLKIPVVAHESDFSIGLANKLCAKHCKTVCTTFEETAKQLKNGKFTGAPVRSSLYIDKEKAKENLNIKSSKPVLTIIGGSQGAGAINTCLIEILPILVKKYQVLHLTGKGNKTEFSDANYKQIEFTSDMASVLSATDLAITRGGSNTIFELANMQKPMLIIPLPKGNSRGDQEQNAIYFKNHGYAEVLSQNELTPETLNAATKKLAEDSKVLQANLEQLSKNDAAKQIAEEIISAAKKI